MAVAYLILGKIARNWLLMVCIFLLYVFICYFANTPKNAFLSLNCIGKVKPSLIVSHQFNMSDYQNAFDVLMSGNGCKIVVDPQNRLCPK